jgi:GTPase SAR1 family protein
VIEKVEYDKPIKGPWDVKGFDLKRVFRDTFYPSTYAVQAIDAPVPAPIWEGIIPSSIDPDMNKVILFGPPSVGKSTFCFDLAEHVQTGQDFLGRKTTATNTLFVSLDMPKCVVFNRWITSGFKRSFDFFSFDPFDCLGLGFQQTQFYWVMKSIVVQRNIGFIIFDALREVHSRNLSDDDVAQKVYAEFKAWFPGVTLLMIHHTRKGRYDPQGKLVSGGTDDDSHGSKYWTNLAQVGVALHKANQSVTEVSVTKSQVYPMLDDPMSIFLDDKLVKVHLWDEAMQQSDKAKLLASEQKLSQTAGWHKKSRAQQNTELAVDLGISIRTLYRMRAAAQKI